VERNALRIATMILRPPRTKFASNPGRVAAPLLFVVGSLGEEDGAEMAVAEAMDSELAVVDCGEECSVVG
jgi:hypothetical protein